MCGGLESNSMDTEYLNWDLVVVVLSSRNDSQIYMDSIGSGTVWYFGWVLLLRPRIGWLLRLQINRFEDIFSAELRSNLK